MANWKLSSKLCGIMKFNPPAPEYLMLWASSDHSVADFLFCYHSGPIGRAIRSVWWVPTRLVPASFCITRPLSIWRVPARLVPASFCTTPLPANFPRLRAVGNIILFVRIYDLEYANWGYLLSGLTVVTTYRASVYRDQMVAEVCSAERTLKNSCWGYWGIMLMGCF